jgi:hypothetical protein
MWWWCSVLQTLDRQTRLLDTVTTESQLQKHFHIQKTIFWTLSRLGLFQNVGENSFPLSSRWLDLGLSGSCRKRTKSQHRNPPDRHLSNNWQLNITSSMPASVHCTDILFFTRCRIRYTTQSWMHVRLVKFKSVRGSGYNLNCSVFEGFKDATHL